MAAGGRAPRNRLAVAGARATTAADAAAASRAAT